MKSYRSARCLISEIQRTLARSRPTFHHSPLEDVAELLVEGRHYSWVGIYLTVDRSHSSPLWENTPAAHPGQLAFPGTCKKILVSMKVAGREIGHLNVESDRENAFGSEERVLLERVAGLLARFLAGPGKYLVLRTAKGEPSPKAAAA